ncbi:MAG TPA: metal ABC transporter substrate-binding protein [Chloroflexota bacterium]|jgi:ABC-type Zn uptake system ZnuABC Zn-binding protein ZnuA|nr:metal ABC transporter substrate-binding protein [Chloroflexota bacterium]
MRSTRALRAVVAAGLALLLTCGLWPPAARAQGRLKVLATVAPIADLVRNVADSRVDLIQLIPDGVDSHTFEPRPSDVRFIAEADLFVLNGLNLELPTQRLINANAKPGAQVLLLADNTITRAEWVFDRSFPESRGNPNPHLWLNVAYARHYVELIRDKLVEMDPANAAAYQANAEQYMARLDQLDQAIFAAVQTIPPNNRRLLTYHDSWPYFARRYGFEIIGAIQPSDFSEPRARDVAAIIDQVRRSGVPAIFGSEVFPSRVLEAIGRETGVRYIDTLRDDDLPGPPGAPEHTYIGMMLNNMTTMVSALGGDASVFSTIDPRNLAS